MSVHAGGVARRVHDDAQKVHGDVAGVIGARMNTGRTRDPATERVRPDQLENCVRPGDAEVRSRRVLVPRSARSGSTRGATSRTAR